MCLILIASCWFVFASNGDKWLTVINDYRVKIGAPRLHNNPDTNKSFISELADSKSFYDSAKIAKLKQKKSELSIYSQEGRLAAMDKLPNETALVRWSLGHVRLNDVWAKPFKIPMSSLTANCFQNYLNGNNKLKCALEDKEFNEILYINKTVISCDTVIEIILCKQYIDFASRSVTANTEWTTETIKGVSRIKELYYSLMEVPKDSLFCNIQPEKKIKIPLNNDNSFSVSVGNPTRQSETTWQFIGFFNSQNKLLDYLQINEMMVEFYDH